MRHYPTIRQLQYLDALADTLSFSQAAEKSFVTQATLSASIKDLEELIGQQLVERTSRKVMLTPFGKEFLDKSRYVLSQADALLDLSEKESIELSGPVRVGIIPTISAYYLTDFLKTMRDQALNAELSITEDITARLLSELEKGNLDLILMAFPFSTDKFEHKILFEEKFYLVTPKDSPIKKKTVSLKELNNLDLLLLTDGHCLKDHAIEACKLAKSKIQTQLKASSLTTLLNMVKAGYGVTLLPEMAVKSGIADALGLKTIEIDSKEATRKIGLCWRKTDANSLKYQKLT